MTRAPWAWASALTSAGSGASVKPAIVKLEGWTRRTTPRPALGQGRLEVRRARAIGRAHLDEPGAGPPDDVRDAHAAADLDELATRHDDPAAATGQPDGQGQRGRVVVGDVGVLGTGQRDQVVLGDPGPRAAPAGRPVQLQQQRLAGQGGHAIDDGGRPGRPPEVGVDEDTRGIDDRLHAGRGVAVQERDGVGRELLDGSLAARRPAAAPRSRSTAVRAWVVRAARSRAAVAGGSAPSTASTLGGRRRPDPSRAGVLDTAGPPWRERVGVEPTTPHVVRRHRC